MTLQLLHVEYSNGGRKLGHNATLYNAHGTASTVMDLYESMLAQFADVPLVFVMNEAFGTALQRVGPTAVNNPVSPKVLARWCVATIRYGKYVLSEDLFRREDGPRTLQDLK